jgi:uncharacterized protein (TIGR01777 family)
MRVIITGGTGLIGGALAEDLAAAGHEVIVLSRDASKAAGVPAGVRVAAWDARTGKGWAHLVEGAGAIVNLAGENIASGRWTGGRKRRIRESRLDAGRAVVEAVEAATDKPQAVIQASGIGFYGGTGDLDVSEESPPGQGFLASFAVEWEACTAGVQDLGVRWAAIRTGVVLSTQGGALPRMTLPLPLVSARRLGGGRQWFPWIHISDEVAAIRFLIEHDSPRGAFNLVAPHPVRNAEFLAHLNRLLRRPVAIPVPALLLRLALGEMATEVLDGQKAAPQRLVEMGFHFQFPDAEGALYDLLRKPAGTG